MDGYRRRIIDDMLDSVQPRLRAVALQGPKAVGKTATATQRAASVLDLDLESQRQILQADPTIITTLPGPVFIDEWQRFPASWDYVRRAVDAGAPRGRFLIAGSTAPRGAAVHSGAGRIVSLRMRPLSLAERGIETPSVSLAALLAGDLETSGRTTAALSDYVREIVASGFPKLRAQPRDSGILELDAYLDAVVHREFPQQGYPVRKPESLRTWLRAYAAATATTATYNTILGAASANLSVTPAKDTVATYREALHSLWLLDPISAWTPTKNYLVRLGQAAKHYVADPALAARLLGLNEQALIAGDARTVKQGPILGALFEHLVALSVHTYAEAARARVFHVRTRNGEHEVDLLIEREDGKVLAIEVKLTDAPRPADLTHLHWLAAKIGPDLIGSVLITTGSQAYTRPDGVAVVPAALLGA